MGEAGPPICPNENSLKESGRRLREEMCRRRQDPPFLFLTESRAKKVNSTDPAFIFKYAALLIVDLQHS